MFLSLIFLNKVGQAEQNKKSLGVAPQRENKLRSDPPNIRQGFYRNMLRPFKLMTRKGEYYLFVPERGRRVPRRQGKRNLSLPAKAGSEADLREIK
jgi:hypothetical protein